MSETLNMPAERPSLMGSFTRGALSSAFSGALMSGIVSVVSPLLSGATILGTLAATAPLMIVATGIFGGVMAVKRVMFDAPREANATQPNFVPVPVQGMSSPAISAPAVSADIADSPDQPSKNWTAETGRTSDGQSRIQQILANGALSDKDRASAILAAREAAASTETGRSA